MDKSYETNEKDIESVMRWLAINDPENATREDAIAMLHDLQSGFHQMSHSNPELLMELRTEIEGSKSGQS
jgi:predicted hydrolase (HD superfamily)